MTTEQAIDLAIRAMRAISTNHDDRMKIIEAENTLLKLINQKEDKKGK